MEINNGFFSQNYIQKNINDKIYSEYIKLCRNNINISDPNKIIQMLALKQKIVSTTDGTDHNLNNYIESWIKQQMTSLVDKFIPVPTAKNIEIFADHLCKYLEVMDICTQKSINLELIYESLGNQISLLDSFKTKKKYIDSGKDRFGEQVCNPSVATYDDYSFKKIIVTIDLQEKFKKINFLLNKLHLFTPRNFNELYNYVVKNQINEKTRNSSFNKTTDSVSGEIAWKKISKELASKLSKKLTKFLQQPLGVGDINNIISDLKKQVKNDDDHYLISRFDVLQKKLAEFTGKKLTTNGISNLSTTFCDDLGSALRNSKSSTVETIEYFRETNNSYESCYNRKAKKNRSGTSVRKNNSTILTNENPNNSIENTIKSSHNISRSASSPHSLGQGLDKIIKASDLESYYIPNSDHNFTEALAKLQNKKQSIEDFKNQLSKLTQYIPKMVANDSKLQKAFQEFKKQFAVWEKWDAKVLDYKNFDTYDRRKTPRDICIDLIRNPQSWIGKPIEFNNFNSSDIRKSMLESYEKSIIKYKKTDDYKTIKKMVSENELTYDNGYRQALAEFLEVHKYSYQIDNLGNRSLLKPSKTTQLLNNFAYYDNKAKELTRLKEEKLKDISVYLPGKYANVRDILKHQEEIKDEMSKLKKETSHQRIGYDLCDFIRCIERIQKYILEIIEGYGANNKKVENGLEKLRSCTFDSSLLDDDKSDDLRKRILFVRDSISSFRQCITDFLSSYDFKNAAETKLAPDCRKILLYYSESLGFIDLYLADIQNRDKASFGPAIRRIKKPVATNPQSPPEKRKYVWGDSNFSTDLPMWRLRRFAPYLSSQDVEQGYIGDCWLSATLQSMARKNPEAILNVFVNRDKEIGDQKINSDNIMSHNDFAQFPLTPYITVRLYKVEETADEYKTNGDYVDIQVPATLLRNSSGNSHWNQGAVLWPHVIEKAVDKYLELFMTGKGNGKGKHIEGGISALAAALLSGKSQKYNAFDETSDSNKILDLLEKMLKKGKAVMCGTKEFKEIDNDHSEGRKVLEWQRITNEEAKNYDWKTKRYLCDDPISGKGYYEIPKRIIWGPHAYFLNKVEKKMPIEDTKIHLINPWGVKDDEVGRNKIYVTLKEFLENFVHVDSEN